MSLNTVMGFELTAKDNASHVFHEVAQKLGVLTAGAATLGGAFELANLAGKFQASLTETGAIAGATDKQLKDLHDAAIQAGIATQFSPGEAAKALGDIAANGFKVKESIDLLNPVLNLAAASMGQLSPEQAAGLAAQGLKTFAEEAKDPALMVDKLVESVPLLGIKMADLPLALGTASRGAGVLGQSLDETLVALGLVHQIVPSVERASTAVAVSMERMVDPKVQASLAGIGVAVKDTHGKFLPFLDIITAMAPGLDKMTEAQRGAFLQATFGGEALGGLNAIFTQLKNGITDSAGVLHKGKDAISELHTALSHSKGKADEFKEKTLAEFAGQKVLLKGSMETLAIAVGEPFAAVFKPIVSGFLAFINGVIAAVQALPDPVKKALGAIVVGAAAFVTFVGAAIAAKAALGPLLKTLQVVRLAFSSMFLTMLPYIAIFAAVALVVAAFVVAFKRDVGGIGTFFSGVWSKVSLFFKGLTDLFESGHFSKAVQAELDKAENSGVGQFAKRVFGIIMKIKAFFGGIADGFADAIQRAKPIFDELVSGLRHIGEVLGIVSSDSDKAGDSLPMEKFKAFGAVIGKVVGFLVDVVIFDVMKVVDIIGGIVSGFKAVFGALSPIFEGVWKAISGVFDEFGKINDIFTSTSENGEKTGGVIHVLAQAFHYIGVVIGAVVAAVAGVIGLVLRVAIWPFKQIGILLQGLIRHFKLVYEFFDHLVHGEWKELGKTFVKIWANGLNTLIQLFLGFGEVVAGLIDTVGSLFGADWGLEDKMKGLRNSVQTALTGEDINVKAKVKVANDPWGAPTGTTGATGADPWGQANPAARTMPAVAQMQAGAQINATQVAAAVAAATARNNNNNNGDKQPIIVTMDGQKVGEILKKRNVADASDSYYPMVGVGA